MTWLRTFWSTLMITLRDLRYHYEVWIRHRNGAEDLLRRLHSRAGAEALAARLRAEFGAGVADVHIVRQRGIHPWTVQIIGFSMLYGVGFLEPMPVRAAVGCSIAAVMLRLGVHGREWIRGGHDDR
jgi:hypothetical protein